MTKINRPDECRALIIGGSLGGLFAGNLLRQIGWDVDMQQTGINLENTWRTPNPLS